MTFRSLYARAPSRRKTECASDVYCLQSLGRDRVQTGLVARERRGGKLPNNAVVRGQAAQICIGMVKRQALLHT
jgi:hypothetical protein